MSYTQDIVEPLIQTLEHVSGLPAHQLAGHAANLDFWIGEIAHCYHVIDGYSDRFVRLKSGEKAFIDQHKADWEQLRRIGRSTPPLKRSFPDRERKEVRRRLSEVVHRFLNRCFKEGLVSEASLREFGYSLGLDVSVTHLN